MGRSRLQRKVARGDENGGGDYDSLDSLSSETRWSDGNPNVSEEAQTSSSGLEGFLDALYEKRAATREAGLKGLIRMLSREVLASYVADKYETLAHQILACMKKGGSSEIALAAQALGLLVLTLGTGDAALRVKGEVEPCLLKAANKAASSTRVAVQFCYSEPLSCCRRNTLLVLDILFMRFTLIGQALDALAIITFVCNVAEDSKDTMAFLWRVVCHTAHEDQKLKAPKPPDVVIAAALSGWTLLLSSLPSYLVGEPLLVSSLPILSSLLRSSDVALRKAAGEAAATLYEAAPDCSDAGNDIPETVVSEVQSDEHPSTSSEAVTDVTKEQVMQDVINEMKTLSVGSSKNFQTRKERADQRKSFRQLLTTLDDGVPREVKVKIPKCKVLIIDTWSDTVQLNQLKHYLGDSGFQAHMQGNTLLHQIFEVELEGNCVRVCDLNLNRVEKRMMFSPNSEASKARTKRLNRTRLSNQAEKTASFNVNGDESD